MKKIRIQSWLFSILFAGVATFQAGPAFASYLSDEEKKEESEEAADEDEDAEPEEDKDRWHAIVGGDIYTGTGAMLKGATMLSLNGKIVELGYDVYLPEEAEVLDATGYRVYPGIVAIASTGLFGAGGDLKNSVDPYSEGMLLGLASGITSAVQSSEIAKLKRGSIEDLVMGSNFFHTLRFGTSSPSGKKDLREKFEKASAFLRVYRAWESNKSKDKGPAPKDNSVDGKILAVLKGEVRAYFSESQRVDLLEIARLAQKYNFRPVINGGGEAWTVADELGRAGATVIVTPRTRNSKDERLVHEAGSSIENAAILHSKGVQVAIRSLSQGNSTMSGIAGRDVIHLPISASFAVRGGLSEQAALEAITLIPARLTGVEHRVGSLEVGKDADCIVTDGDLLKYSTFVQWAVVDGEMVYDKQAEMYYAHIRPRPEMELAPELKVDPGEEPEEGEADPGEGEEGSEKEADAEKESDKDAEKEGDKDAEKDSDKDGEKGDDKEKSDD